MTQKFAVFYISIVVLVATTAIPVAAEKSIYWKYLRTRPPHAPGEVHVEEVLEVFRTRERPPSYGVYNAQINPFLANSAWRKLSTSRPLVTSRTTSTTTTSTTALPEPDTRSTYPTPTRDHVNPDYTFLFKPQISITKYPSYKAPSVIIIQEGTAGGQLATLPPLVTTEQVPEDFDEALENGDAYSYSNEEYFNQQ